MIQLLVGHTGRTIARGPLGSAAAAAAKASRYQNSVRWSQRIPRDVYPEPVGVTPSLAQVLREVNYFRKSTALINIGIRGDQDTENAFKKSRGGGGSEHHKGSEASEHDEHSAEGRMDENNVDIDKLLTALEKKTEGARDTKINIDEVQGDWELSESGVDSICRLAHHFGIFRDLFPQGDPQPTRPFALTRALAENQSRFRPYWMPSSLPESAVDERGLSVPPVHYFRPLVPMRVEFLTADPDEDSSQSSDDNVIVSRPYRGNIILPEYGREEPQIIINSLKLSSQSSPPQSADKVTGQVKNVTLLNESSSNRLYSVFLVNLDSFIDTHLPVVHWAATNISATMAAYSEPYSYLPIYGIRGFGYSRYAAVLFTHPEQLQLETVGDFVLSRRALDFNQLVNERSLVPVGLNWFQTTWGDQCNDVFHNYLGMKAPVYDYVQPQEDPSPAVAVPAYQPFNLYLDYKRDPKEMAAEVLTERLKNVDIYNYHKEFTPPRVPATVHPVSEDEPSWRQATIFKQRNRVGRWRGLRPASALRPLNNNADLDRPFLKHASNARSPLNFYNHYPINRRQPRPLSGSYWMKAPHENLDFRIAETDYLSRKEKDELGLDKY